MAIIDELVSILGFELRGTDKLAQFESGMERAKNHARQFAMVAVSAFAAVSAAAIAGGAMLAKSAIQTGAEFEKLETVLTTIEGSSAKAKASLAWVQQFAKTTPFDLQQVADGFVKMKAYGLDPMDGSFESIGNAASAMGKTLTQGVEAIADAAQGENERLKEFGVRSKAEGDKITYSWQQNGQEMSRTVRKNGSEIVKALSEIFDKRFSGAMNAQSKTWSGMMSNLGDTWMGFQKKIADAGFFDYMRRRLGSLMDAIGELDADGTLDRWAKALSDSFIWVAGGIELVAARVLKHGKFLADWLAGLDPSTVKAVGAAVAALAAWLFPMAWALGVAAFALEDFLSYLQGDKSAFGDFINWIKELTGASDGLATSIAAVTAALGLLLLMRARAVLASIGATVAGGAAAGTGTAAAAGLTLRALLGRIAPFLLLSGDTAGNKYLDADAAERERMRNEANERTRVRNINSGIATSKAGIAERERDDLEINRTPTGRGSILKGGGILGGGGIFGKDDAAGAVVNDSRQDNRNQSVTANVTVNQTVTQATAAPAAAATATGNAVAGAASEATRLATEPAL